MEPDLNGLYKQQVSHGEKRNRAQQRYWYLKAKILIVEIASTEYFWHSFMPWPGTK
jgi:hypothetical protein